LPTNSGSADVAKVIPVAQIRDNAVEIRVLNFDGKINITGLDQKLRAPTMTATARISQVAHFCSMLGPSSAPMKITHEVREYVAKKN
jgi:thiamine biosynthesis protein ThiC